MDMHRFVVLSILKKHELSELYVMMALRSLAMSLISIFVPIYLYTLGYGIPSIILYFITASATMVVLCPVSAKISSKVGIKHGMLFAFFLYFLHYVMLATLGANSQLFFATAVAFGALPLFVSSDMHLPFKLSLRVDGFDKKVAASLVSGASFQANEVFWPNSQHTSGRREAYVS